VAKRLLTIESELNQQLSRANISPSAAGISDTALDKLLSGLQGDETKAQRVGQLESFVEYIASKTASRRSLRASSSSSFKDGARNRERKVELAKKGPTEMEEEDEKEEEELVPVKADNDGVEEMEEDAVEAEEEEEQTPAPATPVEDHNSFDDDSVEEIEELPTAPSALDSRSQSKSAMKAIALEAQEEFKKRSSSSTALDQSKMVRFQPTKTDEDNSDASIEKILANSDEDMEEIYA
jgi:hypothetical protein